VNAIKGSIIVPKSEPLLEGMHIIFVDPVGIT